MNIKRYKPVKLNRLVETIWEQKSDSPSNWQILPSGFVELIFNIGPAMSNVSGKLVGGSFNPTENFCFLSGLHTKPLMMSYKKFHVIGVQMHPLAVKALFDLPCSEVRDWAIPGDNIFNDINKLEDNLCNETSFEAKARWLENYLFEKLNETGDLYFAFKISDVIHNAKHELYSGKKIKIEYMTGYSRMHTLRLFNEWCGLPPAQTVRLYQFCDTIKLLHNSHSRITDIGLKSGFYDQSHFIRVFREFAGMTPGEYKKRMSSLIGQLSF